MAENEGPFFQGIVNENAKGDRHFESLHKRSYGLIAAGLKNACILIIGVGSVGAYMAALLIRSGVGAVILIDPDVVESHNLSRTVYMAADIGKPKVVALKEHLKSINPWAVITCEHAKLENVGKDKLRDYIGRAHLIVCGADAKPTQAIINRLAGFHDKPLIVPGLYARAEGGEVVLSIPSATPCYQCTVAGRNFTGDARANQPKTDYGTGRLQGEVGLVADIHHVTSAAVKLSLSVLSMMTAGDKVAASAFLQGALQNGANYLLMAMTPDYWFFPKVFASTPGQYAYQSLWVESSSNPDCDICGARKTKTDPIDEIAPDIENDQFAEV